MVNKVPDITGLDTVADVLFDFERMLKSENKSPRTIESYVASAKLLDAFLAETGMPRELRKIGREHIETFIAQIKLKSGSQRPRRCVFVLFNSSLGGLNPTERSCLRRCSR